MEYIFFENADYLVFFDDKNEKWFVKNKTNTTYYDLSNNENMSSFLRIFIEDPELTLQEVQKRVADLGMYKKLLSLFPINKAIIFCIRNKMFYWLELSLKWLPYFEIDNELRKSINEVAKDRNFPQHLRHSMIQYLKQ